MMVNIDSLFAVCNLEGKNLNDNGDRSLSPLSLLHYKIHNVRLCCLRNDKMIVLVSSNTGTQREITCAVITKYYALGVRNEMRTVRT